MTITNATAELITISCDHVNGNGANLIMFSGAGNVTVSAPIIDGAATPITKSGAGTLILSGANTYSGQLTLNAGTLRLAHTAAFGTGANWIYLNGGILQLGTTINAAAWTPTISVDNDATIDVDAAGCEIDGEMHNLNSPTFTGGESLTISGVISGGGNSLTVNMDDTSDVITLSGTNTYAGQTILTRGTLCLANTSAFGTGAGGISLGGGTLQLGIAIAAGDWDPAITMSGPATIDIDVAGSTIDQTIGNNGNLLTLTGGENLTISGVISGGGGLTVNMDDVSDVITLSGANLYSGTTTITQGNITTSTSHKIADDSDVTLGAAGVLTLGGFGGQETINTLTGAVGSSIVLGNNTLNVDQDGAAIFAGVISGTGSLNILPGSSAILTLSGANTYTGVTFIQAGLATGAADVIPDTGYVMLLQASGALMLGGNDTINNLSGVGGSTINMGGFTLSVDQDAGGSMVGVISNGALTLAAGSTSLLTLGGANTYAGATTINAGTLRLQHVDAFGSGAGGITLGGGTLQLEIAIAAGDWDPAITMSGPATIDIDVAGSTIDQTIGNNGNLLTITGGEDITLSGVISGGGGLTVNMDASTDAVVLDAANTYNGPTTITQGVVSFNAVNTGVSAITVNGGKLAGTGTIPGTVTMQNGTILAPGGTNGDAAGTLTINNNVTFNNESKFVVTITGGTLDVLDVTGNLTATGNLPNIEIQGGYNTAGIVVPVATMTITGAYTAFDDSALPGGFVIEAAKVVGNDIRFTAMPGGVVPTLNEWGIILSLLLLAGAGIVLMRKQRQTGNVAY